MVDNYPHFVKRLKASHHSVFVVAEWLSAGGYDVRVPAIKIRRHDQAIEDFVDEGDIFISKDGGPERRVEVKAPNKSFTSPEDFGRNQVFLANKAAMERIGDNLAAFVIVSASHTHCICVNAETRPHWYEVNTTPKNTGKPETFYACPMDLVQFRKMRRET